MEFDVIIIGAGPAGISASLYTQRAGLKTLVLYHQESNLEKAKMIENYYGFVEGITGKELFEKGIKQAQNIGVQVEKQEVIKIEQVSLNQFKITTTQKEFLSKTVILATGNKKKTLPITGIKQWEGKGISYCAVCDGFFYRNKEVAVLGNGNYAISETNELLPLAKSITILTNGEKAPEFRADNVIVEDKKIKEIRGENKVQEVRFQDDSFLKIDGIFIAEGVAGSTDFAQKLGAMVKQGMIVVDEQMKTNVKGLYACGDCTGGLLQIAKAVRDGAIAGLQVAQDVRKEQMK